MATVQILSSQVSIYARVTIFSSSHVLHKTMLNEQQV